MADGQRLLDWWMPPTSAGEPVAALATSFTFDTDFFRDDCIARFVGLSSAGDDETAGGIVQIAELEERLAEVTISVLVDRSCQPDARNLRWDLLPVLSPGGLLHAKTSLLLWENAARVIIGSANLTPAGYRQQREIAVAFDLVPGTPVPRQFWTDYAAELAQIVALAPPDPDGVSGPRARLAHTLELLDDRITNCEPPATLQGATLQLIPSRPGHSVVEQIRAVFTGPRARYARAMSPFWDKEDVGSSDAVRAITSLLATTGQAMLHIDVPVLVGPSGHLVQSPSDLESRMARPGIDFEFAGVSEVDGDERRRLHAKALMLWSEARTLVMVGSSNMTAAGLGLKTHSGHRELNVAYVVATDSKIALELIDVFPGIVDLEPDDETFVDAIEADEDGDGPPLPAGFVGALLTHGDAGWALHLSFAPDRLPITWEVSSPQLGVVATATVGLGATAEAVNFPIGESDSLPHFLNVRWSDRDGVSQTADWVVNVADPAALPLDERLRSIPVDLLVDALTRRGSSPYEVLDGDRGHRQKHLSGAELDPLRRFDDSRALLKRITTLGHALDRLSERLHRPAYSVTALAWRLNGLLSPVGLGRGWLDQYERDDLAPEVCHFLLAELHLVVASVDWASATPGLPPEEVAAVVSDARRELREMRGTLPPLATKSDLRRYVLAAEKR